MRLVHFETDGVRRVGIALEDGVCDLDDPLGDLASDPIRFLGAGPGALESARDRAARPRRVVTWDQARLLAPVPRPGKFLAIGLNYADHLAETGAKAPEFPVFFTKQPTCVIGPGEQIEIPVVSDMVDYEGELGVVIGTRCRNVDRGNALSVVAGYTIVNDVSVRDWQAKSPTMMIGKSFDTHGPMGPWIVTPEDIGDPHDLPLRTIVSGEKRQDASTAGMLFDVRDQIATLSAAMTLEPGDVISTGTPAGVGAAMRPPRFLTAGDTVRIEIDGIGHLENPVGPARAIDPE